MFTKYMLFILPLLLLGSLLTSCGGTELLDETSTRILTTSLTPSQTDSPTPTFTPSMTPSLTASLTETPTMTPLPSHTPPPSVISDTLPISNTGTITNTLVHSMSLIPAGAFQMGSIEGQTHESPVHTVELDAFYIDQTEVTNAQYAACIQAGVCVDSNATKIDDPAYGQHPMNNVSWYDAQTYCQWRDARLPTEAEWEIAARGGLDGMRFPWGDDDPVCDLGASNGAQFTNCSEPKFEKSIAVGMFGSNGYGIYDLAGNILEWVNDWYHPDYYGAYPTDDWVANPQGPENGTEKVLRGGDYFSYPYKLTVSYRNALNPNENFFIIGFRCVVSTQGN